MTEQLRQSLPAVFKVLADAEALINEITGVKVKVSVRVTETHRYHQYLIDLICEYFGVSFLELVSQNRKRELALARQVFIYLTYKPGVPGSGSQALADILQRDHSSILYAHKRITGLLDVGDESVTTAINNLQQLILDNEKAKN